MDRGTYHRARGLFGFGYRAINHRSGRPNGAQGDSPGQSEAPPWDWCARNNPSPERAEPATRKPMCYVSPFQGLGELGRRRAKVAGVPRVALRSTLGYLIMPRWGERSRGSYRGSSPSDRGHFQQDDHTPTNRRAVTSATGSLLLAKPSEPDRSPGVCRQFLIVRRVRAAVP